MNDAEETIARIRANFPAELLSMPNWVCWRYQERKGKRTKVPYNPVTGNGAKSNDVTTWASFEDAASVAADYDGIGVMFSEGVKGVDIDHCIDPETGEIAEHARDIVETMNTYTELSPSGTGLHMLCMCDRSGAGRRSDLVEVYGTGRYFTVTGRVFGGEARALRHDARDAIKRVVARYIDNNKPHSKSSSGDEPGLLAAAASGGISSTVDDSPDSGTASSDGAAADHEASGEAVVPADVPKTLHHDVFNAWGDLGARLRGRLQHLDARTQNRLQKMFASKRGEALRGLYDGDITGYPSSSEADIALCDGMAFYLKSLPDAENAMDEAFRASGLMRNKWDEKHGADTYGAMTIRKSLDDTRTWYGKGAAQTQFSDDELDAMLEETEQQAAVMDAEMQKTFRAYSDCYTNVDGYKSIRGMTFAITTDARTGEPVNTLLANATILWQEDVLRDNGMELSRVFRFDGINARGRRLPLVDIPASDFDAMKWLSDAWGADVNVEPRRSAREQLRHAINAHGMLYAAHRTVYTHTGWRKIDGKWIFLHGGGGVGADRRVEVELFGGLDGYVLPDAGGAVVESLRLLDVMPGAIAWPLLGLMYLAPLTEFMEQAGCVPSFVLFLRGSTGTHKSTAAALALSHFGASWSYSHMPANFHDTANNLREKAFLVKDAPLLVDDFHPSASKFDREGMTRIAQELFRTWGDRHGRGRLERRGTGYAASSPHNPRGVGLMTGEQLPDASASGLARALVVDVHRGDVAIGEALTALQEAARRGTFAAAMRSFIEWLIPQANAGTLPDALRSAFDVMRQDARKRLAGAHDRTPDAIAALMVGINVMLKCMFDRGEITEQEASAYMGAALEDLLQDAGEQTEQMTEDAPCKLFCDTLSELLMSGTAKITTVEHADVFMPVHDTGVDFVGYEDADGFVYLMPNAAYSAVCHALEREGRVFPLSRAALWREMAEGGYIQADSMGNPCNGKKIAGKLQRLVWLQRSRLSIPDYPLHKWDAEENKKR